MIIVSPKDLKPLKCKDPVTLKCECCAKEFTRPKNQVLAALNGSKKSKLKYCSKECQWKMQRTKVEVECMQCKKKFSKLPSQINRTKNNFCSSSCAAKWNNMHTDKSFGPPRVVFSYCKICNDLVPNGHKYCEEHKSFKIQGSVAYCTVCGITIKKGCKSCKNHKVVPIPLSEQTIKDAEDRDGRPANKYRNIRCQARSIAKKAGMLNKCKICGYSKHVVVCHIDSISSFDKNTLVGVVNDPSNLVGLCKNHHWELDHNALSNKDAAKLLD